MDGSYNKTVREFKEGIGLLQSGLIFRQEKRYRIGESHVVTEIRGYERKSHGKKQPYNEEGDDQATP